MGILGFICTQFPTTYMSIVFLPMLKFTAGTVCRFNFSFIKLNFIELHYLSFSNHSYYN